MSTGSATVPAVRTLDLTGALVELVGYGPPSEVRGRAPALAARCLALDRVLLARLDDGRLVAEALHLSDARAGARMLSTLQAQTVSLEYPLAEGEITRRRRAELIRSGEEPETSRYAFVEALGPGDYIAAPILLDGRVVGLLRGDCDVSARRLSAADVGALEDFALVFGVAYERAVLRTWLRAQREEMRQVAAWAGGRAGELEDRSISLAESTEQRPGPGGPSSEHARATLRDLLTRREIEVLELMVRGQTNSAIARDLVLSTGTVKFHVKNILRKLHAANRAEATSRYLRLTLGSSG